ncbi:MAG: ferrochelatase, partial [Parvularculaceae bacterium]
MTEATLTGRALIVGERINTSGLERGDVYATAPLAFKAGEKGFAALYRHGAAVLIGMSPLEEDEVLRGLEPRIVNPSPPREDEIIRVRLSPEGADQVTPDGVISLKSFAPEHLLVVADILAKSAALDSDERQVAKVFDAVEPFLYNLFCDPDIIDFPGAFLARKALARFISTRRSKKVAAHYAEI